MHRPAITRSTLGRAAFAGITAFVASVCGLHVVQSGKYAAHSRDSASVGDSRGAP